MTTAHNSRPIARRDLLRGGAAAAALAFLPSCDSSDPTASTASPDHTESPTSTGTPATVGANVRVSDDRYGVHVEPTVAVNPLHPHHLLAACQVSPTADPQFLATYVSYDSGATWHSGGMPRVPAGANGDDVTVAFDAQGRGYLCATSYAAGRGVFVWRTDDGGRTFSAPVTVLQNQYCDHPWVATGHGHAYVVWGAGDSKTALDLARSTDGGQTFEAPRRILPESTDPSRASAGPELATGPDGLVCAVCDWTTQQDRSGDMVGQVVAVSSTDAGQSFGAPVHLGSETSVITLPGDVQANSSPSVAASPRGDALYVAFPKRRSGSAHSDIVVVASRDRGRTWHKAVTATPTDAATYFQPNLAVDATGRVGISAFALANGRVDQVLLVSRPRELRFGPPVKITSAPFDPRTRTTGGKHGAWWVGDYQGIAAGVGVFHLVWNGARNGKLDLYAATVRP